MSLNFGKIAYPFSPIERVLTYNKMTFLKIFPENKTALNFVLF